MIFFGAEHYPGRGDALDFLLLRTEEPAEFPRRSFLASIWGRTSIDYAQKVTEGVRRLAKLGSKCDGLGN